MIISFKCKDTEKLASGHRIGRFVHFERIALRKIRQLQAASQLDDLKVPPGNMLEPLSGDRLGQFSIRINKQFRVRGKVSGLKFYTIYSWPASFSGL